VDSSTGEQLIPGKRMLPATMNIKIDESKDEN